MKYKLIGLILVIGILLLITSCSDTTEPKQTVAAPVFDPPGGYYTSPQEVTISCETEGAVIRFTDDGSEPDEGSPEYVEPVELSAPVILRARAFKEGWEASEIASADYDIELETVHRLEFQDFPDTLKVDQVVDLTVKVTYEDGEPVEDGTEIIFEVDKGFFEEDNSPSDTAKTLTAAGIGTVKWNTGTSIGDVVINAHSGDIVETNVSFINPGEPESIRIEFEHDTIHFYEGDNSLTDPEYIDVKAIITIIDDHKNRIIAEDLIEDISISPKNIKDIVIDETERVFTSILRIHGWTCPPPIDEPKTITDIQFTVTLKGTDIIGHGNLTAKFHKGPKP